MNFDFNPADFMSIEKPKGERAENILVSEIKQFQMSLKENENLQIFASGASFIIQGIRHRNEYIIFEGVSETGNNCRLVQNVHQINFTLSAVQCEKDKKIGFISD